MGKLNKYQEQLLSVISLALFSGEKNEEELPHETLKEANQQAVLALVSQDREVLADFYILHAQTIVNPIELKKVDTVLLQNGFHPIESNKHSSHLAYRRERFGVNST